MKESAKIYRMVTPKHLCPWGLKAKDLLERKGYEIEDHHLESMEANKAYKEEHGVSETPQIYIGDEHIGGYDELREYFNLPPDPGEGETYQPVIAIFATAFLMAVAANFAVSGSLLQGVEWFVAFSMCLLALMKLRDVRSFSTQFLSYDLLAQKVVPYAYIYPFIELGAGVLMIAGALTFVSAPAALIIGTIGAVSVIKAVYIEKRELKCACVGGNSSVPLGFISLTENLMMMAMGIWMLLKMFI